MRHRAAEQELEAKRTQFRFILLFIAAGILLVVSAIVGYMLFRT
jgi:flagellar basal body-associated protein FliL